MVHQHQRTSSLIRPVPVLAAHPLEIALHFAREPFGHSSHVAPAAATRKRREPAVRGDSDTGQGRRLEREELGGFDPRAKTSGADLPFRLLCICPEGRVTLHLCPEPHVGDRHPPGFLRQCPVGHRRHQRRNARKGPCHETEVRKDQPPSNGTRRITAGSVRAYHRDSLYNVFQSRWAERPWGLVQDMGCVACPRNDVEPVTVAVKHAVVGDGAVGLAAVVDGTVLVQRALGPSAPRRKMLRACAELISRCVDGEYVVEPVSQQHPALICVHAVVKPLLLL
mmetsp:Transcript_3738/g.7530  ORF Transcript_3738/g.7530 Transcript_3738/m.7530 type:complete len:281 (+) Transcript_3738:146-988(+)